MLLLALAWLVAAGPASAHGRSVSYSSWTLDEDGAHVSLRLPLLELTRIGPEALPPGVPGGPDRPGAPDLPARAFPSELVLRADGRPCNVARPARRQPDREGWIRYAWRVDCPSEARRLSIQSRLLLTVAPGHMHFVRARVDGQPDSFRESVLTESAPELVVREPPESRSTGSRSHGAAFADYLALGVEHILSGWDHLAFVLGLLLLASRFGEVARLITGFTLAHSLTLALAVMDLVYPRAAAVEAVIAFSVALVAVEKGWLTAGRPRSVPWGIAILLVALLGATLSGRSSLPTLTVFGLLLFSASYFGLASRDRGRWLRVCLTFAFGLVHGFGFAGVLVEMTLPPERLVPALLGFNVGVELGQIAVVAVLLPALSLLRRLGPPGIARFGTELATAGLCGLGVFWLVERAF